MLFNAISGQIIEMSIIQIRSCSLILTFFLSLSFPDTEMVSCKQPYWKLRCNAKKKKFRKINANVKCKNVTNLYFNVNAQPMLSGVCTVNVRKRNVPFGKPNTFVFSLKSFGSFGSFFRAKLDCLKKLYIKWSSLALKNEPNKPNQTSEIRTIRTIAKNKRQNPKFGFWTSNVIILNCKKFQFFPTVLDCRVLFSQRSPKTLKERGRRL